MQRQQPLVFLVLLLSIWIGGFSEAALAQGAKRFIVSTAAGGGLDTIARKLSEVQSLRSAWGNPILIDNHPGQNGMTAVDFARNLPGDGSVLLAVFIAESGANVAAYAPTIAALAGFVPIAYLGSNTGPSGKFWYGIYGPPGMPPDTARRLESALQNAMQSSEVASAVTTFSGWQQDRAVSAATLAQLTGAAPPARSGGQTGAPSAGRQTGGPAETSPSTNGDSAACRCLTLSADRAGEIIRNTCSREVVAFLCVDGYNCRGETTHIGQGLGARGGTGSNIDHFRVRNTNHGQRQRWSYGAEFTDTVRARNAFIIRWPEVQSYRWTCSENRAPIIIP